MTIKTVLLCAAATVMTIAAPAQAAQGDILVRLRGIMVAPNEKSGNVLPAFQGEKVKVNDTITPEIDITYMATNHVGFELIAATSRHTVSGVTGTTGSIGKLAGTNALPPTLTAQYHFAPDGHVRPYVGAGLNYTIFFNSKASSALEGAVGGTKVHLSDSFGWAAQAGVDIDLTDRLFLNLDVKYIDIDTTARLATTAAGVQKVKVSLDPLVFGVGVGMRF